MAQLWSTGPIFMYVAPPGVSAAVAAFLGTGEEAPQIETRPQWEPVFNDIGGSKIPMDQASEGEDGLISVTLSRWNENIYTALTTVPRASSALLGNPNAIRGSNIPGDIGTLAITEQEAFQLWCVFPYSQKAAYTTMVPGYRFPATMLEGHVMSQHGAKPRLLRLVFHAMRSFDTGYSNSLGIGKLTCYDSNVSGLPAAN